MALIVSLTALSGVCMVLLVSWFERTLFYNHLVGDLNSDIVQHQAMQTPISVPHGDSTFYKLPRTDHPLLPEAFHNYPEGNFEVLEGTRAYSLIVRHEAPWVYVLAQDQSEFERTATAARVQTLTTKLPPLPNFSRFHPAFVPDPTGGTLEGDMRRAFFLSYDPENCEHLLMDGSVVRAIQGGRTVVSAAFVTPYPPGFPVLVPGQVVTEEVLEYLKALDVKEIHGYDSAHGLRVFTEEALALPSIPPTA